MAASLHGPLHNKQVPREDLFRRFELYRDTFFPKLALYSEYKEPIQL